MSYQVAGNARRASFAKRRRTVAPKDGTVVVTAPQAQLKLAQKVARLQKAVKGITPEVKFIEVSSSFPNITDAAGGVVHQTGIAAGTDIAQRVADKIRLKAIRLHVRVATGTASLGATPTNEEFTRFILVQDTQQVADTTPAAADIVNNVARPQFPTPALDANGRFKWLWVSPLFCHARLATTALVAALTTPVTPTQTPVAYYTNAKCDIPITYNGTASTDIQKNGLYLVVLTNLAADTLDADATVRFDYIDD